MYIRYFKRGDQMLVRNNVTGDYGSTDNQTVIKLQNIDDKYYLEFHASLCSVSFFFFFWYVRAKFSYRLEYRT